MTDCPSCLRAQQIADHRDFRARCIGCDVRQLALMPIEQRRQVMEAIRQECGEVAFNRVRRDALIEAARIVRLKRITRGGKC